jgi:hypothetical protein
MKIESFSLRALKKQFDLQVFAVPEIQRQFVWNKRQVLKICDSIYNNYPIGTGLIWEAPYSKAIRIRPNNKTIIPPFNRRNKKANLVIDGQQRLSTIFGILHGTKPNLNVGSQIDFTELFFNCNLKEANRFVFSSRYDENSKGFIRLTTLLNTAPSQLKIRLKLRNWEANAASKCYKSFHSYKFYLLKFSGLDYNDVKEIFIRINSAGTTVNRADTLFARATNVNLRDHLMNTRRSLKNGFDGISVESMQNTLALVYGANRIDGKAYEHFISRIEADKLQNKDFHKKWRDLEYGYEEATDFLVQYLKVLNPSLLPSQNLFSMLSYFFYLNKRRARPNQIKEIKKWFWFTCCGERYSGAGFNRNVPDDIQFFKRLSKRSSARFPVIDLVDAADFLKTNYKSSGSTISTAYRLLLRSNKPLYLANGHEMLLDNYSSVSNRKDQHHIFPNNLLRNLKVSSRWSNSIANICYLESDENQSFGDKPPYKYLLPYKKTKHFTRVMKSHFIPCSSESGVWEKALKIAFAKFLAQRGRAILSAIELQAGIKLFNTFDGVRRI